MAPTTPSHSHSPVHLPTPPSTPPSNIRRRRSTLPATSRRRSSSQTTVQLAARLHSIDKLLSEESIPTPPSSLLVLETLARRTLKTFESWTPQARRITRSVLKSLFIESEEWLMVPPTTCLPPINSTVRTCSRSWIESVLQDAISADEQALSAASSTSFLAESIASEASLTNSPDITTPLLRLLKTSPPGIAPSEEWLPPLLSFIYLGAFQSEAQLQREALEFLPVFLDTCEAEVEEDGANIVRRELGQQPMFWVAMRKFQESPSRTVRRLAEGLGIGCRE